MKRISKLLTMLLQGFVFIMICRNDMSAQSCGGCTTLYSSNVSDDITVDFGDIVCIAKGVTCSGMVTMQGGVLCNEGVINDLFFKDASGTINNYGSITVNVSDISLANLVINNFSGGYFEFKNDVYLEMYPDSWLNINVYNPSKFNIDRSFNVNSGNVLINNGYVAPGNTSATSPDPSTIDMNSISFNGSSVKLVNSSFGIWNVAGAMSLNECATESISNNGVFNIYGSLNLSFTDYSPETALLENFNSFYVGIDLNVEYSQSSIVVNNAYSGDANTITPDIEIGGLLDLNGPLVRLNNSGQINIGGELRLNNGRLDNKSSLVCNNLTNTGGIFSNNSFTQVNSDLINSGTINLGVLSFLRTFNYTNNPDGSINGSSGANDISEYPKILIDQNSTNGGAVRDKILIYDMTLSRGETNAGYGFDVLLGGSQIDDGTDFATTAPVTGEPPVQNCNFLNQFYLLSLTPDGMSVCSGQCITMTPYFSILINPNTAYAQYQQINWSNYQWQPGGQTAPTMQICPTDNTIVTISTTYNTCVYTATAQVFVNGIIVSPGPTIYPPNTGTTYQMNPGISGGTPPYSCVWSSSSSGWGATMCNPPYTANMSETLKLVVTDAGGCTGTGYRQVRFAPDQYAELKYQHDGEYYLAVGHLFHFRYMGQYTDNTQLTYELYDDARNLIGCSNLVQNVGDNRFVLDFNACSTSAAGFYSLEVTNDKNEKTVLRIKKS